MMRLAKIRPLLAAVIVSLSSGCSGTNAGFTSSETAPASLQGNAVRRYRAALDRNGARSVWPAGLRTISQRPSWMRPAPVGAADPHLAVAEFGTTSVLWFPKNDRRNAPPTTCEPASSTNGIAIDANGNLWVPDGRADTTTEYAPNCGPKKMTIPDSTGEPADVGFDRKRNVYILNINDTSGPPTVEVYDAQAKHIGTLGDPSFSVLFGIGTDNKDNVFVSNLTSGNVGNVVEFVGGKMPGKALSGVSLGLPGSPVFDSANNMIVSDWERLTIDVFSPPYKAAPKTAPLMGQSIWCPLGHHEKRIYCGDAQNGSIDVYAYPGATYLYSYSSGLSPDELVTGVAPDPTAPL